MKNILVATNHLKNLGGSETFTYTMIESLIKKNYEVEYFTFQKGLVSDKIEKDLGINFMSKKRYDVVLANHNTTIKYLKENINSKFIQTCHGIFPPLEQPYKYADGYVAISEEVKQHLTKLGHKCNVILNGINCNRFKLLKPPNPNLTSVLSLCQSKEANATIKEACEALNLRFTYFDKNINPVWDVERIINNHDLVIGLGRSVYEAMACGRPVIIYDSRSYASSYADGYLDIKTLLKSLENNCSGRYYKYKFSSVDLINELKKYNPKDGIYLQNYVSENLNIENQIDRYIKVAKKTNKNKLKQFRFWFKLKKQGFRNLNS